MAPTRAVNPKDLNTLMEALELENERMPDDLDDDDASSSTTDSDAYGNMEMFLAELEATEDDDPDVEMYAWQVRAFIAQESLTPSEDGWVTNEQGGVVSGAATEETGENNHQDVAATAAERSGWKSGDVDGLETAIDLQTQHHQYQAASSSLRILANEADQRKVEAGRWVVGGESNANHIASGDTLFASQTTFIFAHRDGSYGDGMLQIQVLGGSSLICERVGNENGEMADDEADGAAAASSSSVSASQPPHDNEHDESAQQQQQENQAEQIDAQRADCQETMLGRWVRLSCMQDLGNMDQE